MEPVDPFEMAGCEKVVIGEGQPEYFPIPALVYSDGTVLIEWAFTAEERVAIARGENLRHWIWKHPAAPLQPIKLEVTGQLRG